MIRLSEFFLALPLVGKTALKAIGLIKQALNRKPPR